MGGNIFQRSGFGASANAVACAVPSSVDKPYVYYLGNVEWADSWMDEPGPTTCQRKAAPILGLYPETIAVNPDFAVLFPYGSFGGASYRPTNSAVRISDVDVCADSSVGMFSQSSKSPVRQFLCSAGAEDGG